MPSILKARPLSVAALCAVLAACGSADPVAYTGLASSAQLAAQPQGGAGRIPYRYSTPVNWQGYGRVILEPVAIYRGADNQFGGMAEADRQALARQMQARFAEKLGERFVVATDAAPGTLRLRLTLTGAAASTPVLAPWSRVDLGGAIYNGVQSMRGGEGLFTGSVSYAVEIYDAASNRLLDAFVTRQYPDAFNITASLGALSAAEAGIGKGAEQLLAQIR